MRSRWPYFTGHPLTRFLRVQMPCAESRDGRSKGAPEPQRAAESAAQAVGGPQRRTRPSLGARGRWHRCITMARRNSSSAVRLREASEIGAAVGPRRSRFGAPGAHAG